MPPFLYRTLNVEPPRATDSELEELEAEHPSKYVKKEKG